MTRRLLGVFAHPDDESFGPAATLAVHSSAGVEVHIVAMTDGAAGTPAEGYPEGEGLVAIRRAELRRAAQTLGAALHHLDYRDSGFIGNARNDDPRSFMNVDPEGPTAQLVGLIRAIRPAVVLTHHETGGYPDRGAAFAPSRLYSDVVSNRWARVLVTALRLARRDPTRMGVNADVDLTGVGVDPSTITTRIDIRSGWPAKKEAGACHASQGGGSGPIRFLPAWLLARLWPRDTFVRVHPPPWPGLVEHSLFD
jgi:LmbE family N-acetylglucosaminyl deacetylase